MQYMSVVGVIVIIGIAYIWSTNRPNIPWRAVVWGVGIQCCVGVLLFAFPPGVQLIKWFGVQVTMFLKFAEVGSRFLFGRIGTPESSATLGFQFALTIVPIIVFFSACISVLYHYNIIQKVVSAMAWVLRKTMRTTAVESLSAAANVFLGQTEAPLIVRHYIPSVSTSELFALMVGGFATIAGSTMGVYIAMGIPADTMVIASIIAAPGALALAKIAVPPIESTTSIEAVPTVNRAGNAIDALAHGAMDGFKLAVNVIVVLLAFVAVAAFADAVLVYLHDIFASAGFVHLPSSLKELFGLVFLPFAYLVGIPWHEAEAFSALLGTKIALTEFIAYSDLSNHIASGTLSARTTTLASIALCGFANIASIGIQIGGFGMMAPERRIEVSRMGLKAMCIGALANLMATAIAGLFIPI